MVTGTADCKWAGSENPKIKDEVKSFIAHDAFLLSTISLVGSEGGDPIDLDIGNHSFIFSSPLPLNIPSSYESEYGNVSYKIEAIFHQPWRISHLRVKQDFNLVTFVDLNKDPSLKMPFYMETSKKIRSLLRSSKAMQLKVGIPFSGYVSGQKMRIMFDVENKSHSSVKNMLIHFVEVITLTSPKPNEMTKTIRKIILSMTAMGARKKSVDQFEADFTVPCDLVPVHCNIIKIDYEVEIVAKISSKMKKSPRFTIPIELGTVPLQFVDMRRKSSQSLLRKITQVFN